MLLLLLLLTWTPVCEVCRNHEVVVLQTLTGTALDLGSVDLIITTYSSHLLLHLF